ncbi:MAG: helix-turn-helix transcriptional regulator [Thiohalospira sp.]
MADSLHRQWTLLRAIPRQPGWMSTAELHERLAEEGFDVSRRTVQRDLNALSTLFPLVSEEDGSGQLWGWMEGAPVLDLPGLSPASALAFRLAELHLRPILAPEAVDALEPHFQAARQVLTETDSRLARWPDRVRVLPRNQRLLPPSVNREAWSTLCTALMAGRQVRATYYARSRGGEPKEYRLHPLGLVVRDEVTYLVATANDYDDILLMALHRFGDVTERPEPATPPPDFDLDDWIDADQGPDLPEHAEPIRLEARFRDETAVHLYETPLSPDQELTPEGDGWTRLTATVAETAQLRWWILGFGANAQVCAQDDLRNRLAVEVRKMARLYTPHPH